jgi:hypothetical protein
MKKKERSIAEFFKRGSYVKYDDVEDLFLICKSNLSMGDVFIFEDHVCSVVEQSVHLGELFHDLVYEDNGDDFYCDVIWEKDVKGYVTFGNGECIIWNKVIVFREAVDE